LRTRHTVDLFVGFGGVARREKVEKGSDVYIVASSVAPILPMAAGESGMAALRGTPHEGVLERGLALCRDESSVGFHSPALKAAFAATFDSE
jgi:hypothetical protein